MKRFISITVVLICVFLLLFGKMHWNNKIEQATAKADVKVEKHNTQVKKEKVAEKKEEEKAFTQLTANLPKPIAEKVITAKDSEEKLKILVMGSDLIISPEWKESFAKQLNTVYGPGIFEYQLLSYGKNTTLNVLHNDLYKQAVESSPDIVLFEPLLLNDNGKVSTRDTLYTVEYIGNAFKEKNPNVAYIIMPPNPIYQPNHYQSQVDELKALASEQGYTYLDYWQTWPETDSEEIKEYLSTDNETVPNQKGYEAWISYVVNFLSGK